MQTVFSYRVVENMKIISLTYSTPCMSAGYLLFYAVLEYCIFKIKVSYKYAARRGGNLAAVVCGVLRRLRPRTSWSANLQGFNSILYNSSQTLKKAHDMNDARLVKIVLLTFSDRKLPSEAKSSPDFSSTVEHF